ncbi:MAG: hypothetical protein JNL67_07920, partial [Planctomycetaceae bacterium]|nr:hypothetical protein [Planctomycetaceae bacterium]
MIATMGVLRVTKAVRPQVVSDPDHLKIVCPQRVVRRRLRVERQKTFTFECDGTLFEEGLRIDLLAESCVVVELKSLEKLAQ